MTEWIRYALGSLLVVGVGLAVTIPWLPTEGRSGALRAGLGGLLLQVALFGWLRWGRDEPRRFMAAWLGGMLARLLAVGCAGVWVMRDEAVDPLATLLTLVAVLFGLTLLEPRFLGRVRDLDTGRS